METENEITFKVDKTVKELQETLFPATQKISSSYFTNFLLKVSNTDIGEDLVRVRESTSSKDLLSLNRDIVISPQLPRWPTECQVLDERVTHINYVPSVPEPYYNVSGREVQPRPASEECGIIVYQYIPISAVNYFSRSSIGGSKYLLAPNICPEDNSLKFESRFESGNLEKVVRITPSYYELYIRSDLYTNRHMQWFYFKVSSMRKNFLYRFSIVNFTKGDSLYNEGMKPLMYSTKDSHLHSIGWRRCGENITYYCNDNIIPEDADQQLTYTLTFTMEFPHDEDEVYIAHSYPYTYSDLQDHLMEISNHPVKSTFSTLRLLCKSLAGNNVYYITITAPPPTSGEIKKKKAVVLTARVHPGETPASWMMKGVLDFLTSDSGPAKELRDKFIFKIVPMLNPDGVIVGNNRCSLAAKDLNRQYRTVMRDAYPSIWYTKLMVRRLLEECGVAIYCDFHAHSRKHNIFIYGCENRRGGEKTLQEQVFPLMLHKNTADKFSFESCKFRIQKAKEGTGRIVMWMMGIGNSYTMEASFAGSTMGTRSDTHFSTLDYEQMGRSFCQTLLDFYDDDPRKERLRDKIICRLMKKGSNADEPLNIQLSDYTSDEGDTSSSSSNEAGHEVEEEDIFFPIVPPSTPIVFKKVKPKLVKSKKQIAKSPSAIRKPLPICKATLGLSLSEKDTRYSSDSDSSASETAAFKKSQRKRRQKKKSTKKNPPMTEHSDSEIQIYRRKNANRSISVLDLFPIDKLPVEQNRSKTPQYRQLVDKRCNVTQQLSEVQAKLFALRNKIWYRINVDDGENGGPLTWGPAQPSSNHHRSAPKSAKKNKKKTTINYKIQEKNEKKNNKVINKKEQGTSSEKSQKKPHTGIKRQTAIECWDLESSSLKIRKSKSLPDTSIQFLSTKSKNVALSCDDDAEGKVGKKKKKKKKNCKKVNNR